jgi:hypothetical protein
MKTREKKHLRQLEQQPINDDNYVPLRVENLHGWEK